MKAYQLEAGRFGAVATISTDSGRTHIPLNQANLDCRQFIVDWKASAKVTNADGSPALYSVEAVRALGLEP